MVGGHGYHLNLVQDDPWSSHSCHRSQMTPTTLVPSAHLSLDRTQPIVLCCYSEDIKMTGLWEAWSVLSICLFRFLIYIYTCMLCVLKHTWMKVLWSIIFYNNLKPKGTLFNACSGTSNWQIANRQSHWDTYIAFGTKDGRLKAFVLKKFFIPTYPPQ